MTDTRSLNALCQQIEQWRQDGAAQVDPVRYCFLQRQSERLQQLRHCSPRSLQRLANAVDDYTQRLRRPASRTQSAGPTGSPLAELHALLQPPEPVAPASGDPLSALLIAQENDVLPTSDEAAAPPSDHPVRRELSALTRARRGQQQQHKQRRIEQALTQTPSDAGPLNSHRLVTHAIHTLKDLSPAYLDHFVNYVDTLMVLEKAGKKRP